MSNLRDIARDTALSVATVSRALRSDPAVHPSTRHKVLAAAKKLGYQFNPYVGQLMSSLRQGRGEHHKGNLALIWFDTNPASNRHENMLVIRKSVHARAEELGYTVDEFFRNEYTPKTLRSILRSRGVRGIIISPPITTHGKTHLRMDLSGFAAISLGWALVHPALHSVRFDHYRSMHMALHHARHRFAGRIAAVWNFDISRRADHVSRAAFLAYHPSGPAIADKLFFDINRLQPAQVKTLLEKHRVECLICEAEVTFPWLYDLIPPEHFIYLARPRQTACFAWVDPRYDLLGKWGVDFLTSTLQRGEYDIPTEPKTMEVPGTFNIPDTV
ncbi:MAG: hypothetical protein B9S32_17220 [Verrucomicrobia bacterium Tous-C9LFEB]|nr:MAG: hypothetical protein B9S32_17220 [Verrucomicrobia bacterium Tous-C9LFEB]